MFNQQQTSPFNNQANKPSQTFQEVNTSPQQADPRAMS